MIWQFKVAVICFILLVSLLVEHVIQQEEDESVRGFSMAVLYITMGGGLWSVLVS